MISLHWSANTESFQTVHSVCYAIYWDGWDWLKEKRKNTTSYQAFVGRFSRLRNNQNARFVCICFQPSGLKSTWEIIAERINSQFTCWNSFGFLRMSWPSSEVKTISLTSWLSFLTLPIANLSSFLKIILSGMVNGTNQYSVGYLSVRWNARSRQTNNLCGWCRWARSMIEVSYPLPGINPSLKRWAKLFSSETTTRRQFKSGYCSLPWFCVWH